MATDVQVVAKEAMRFDITQEDQALAMLQHLDEFGYAVVANAADANSIEQAKASFWDFWEKEQYRGPLDRKDPKTWNNWMANGATGILVSSRGANHNEFLWNARVLPIVKETFAKVWGEEDLIVSYDAGGVFRPWTENIHWLTNGGWWHVDQNSTRGAHRCGRVTVQGLVTYYDATAESGGLCVIPGSHKHHEEVCKRAPSARMKMDFVSIPKDDAVLRSEQAVLICAKAGELILWDSRTVHCNTPALAMADHFANKLAASATAAAGPSPVQDASNTTTAAALSAGTDATGTTSAIPTTPNPLTADSPANTTAQAAPELLRLVAYVCMVPRNHASPEILGQRKQAFCHRLSTPHYPTYEIALLPPEKLLPWTQSRDILQLVGYSEREIARIQEGLDPDEGGIRSVCTIS